MENIIIETPLRNISLRVEGNRDKLSVLEEESLKKYTELHHFIFQISEGYRVWYNQALAHRTTLQHLVQEIEILEGKQKRFGEIAGYSIYDIEGPDNQSYTLKPGEFQKEVQEFEKVYNAFFAAFKPFVAHFSSLEKDYEQYDSLFTEFDKSYFAAMWKDCTSMRIDMCRLDDDYNELKELLQIHEIRDKAIDEYNTLPYDYQAIVPRIERIYSGLKSIFDNIKMWEEASKNSDEGKAMWN